MNRPFLVLTCWILAIAACSAKSGGSSGSGGGSGTGGSQASGGATGTGGVTGGGGSTATGGSGGAASGGATGSGGAGTAGTGGASPGTGGVVGTGGSAVAGASGSLGGIGVACGDAAPYTTTGTPTVNLAVNAASTTGAPWNRFYERGVATDHANTILSTVYGRNIQAALKKGHDQAGFQYARFHGILDSDIGLVVSVQGGSTTVAGTLTYDWTKFDAVYDAVVAAGMRAVVEISFMPPPLASGAATNIIYYGGMPPNFTPPASWPTWQALMGDIVRHLETKYGQAEIRGNWYFEVWNEPVWMYSLADAGYNQLYQNTIAGLLAADPQVRVGGPAELSGVASNVSDALIKFTKAANPPLKLDFISYHRYGNDNGGQTSDANGNLTFQRTMAGVSTANTFPGELINDEFGPTYLIDHTDGSIAPARDNESSASFIAKTIHLIGTDTTVKPPSMYAYWALSDLYEEQNTGTQRAYREGNWGLLLKGDPAIPESFDLAKPAFNAFRLLHRMGATQVPLTGGTTANGVNGVATMSADRNTLQILVYNHTTFTGGVAETMADPTQSTLVSLTVSGIPFAPGAIKVRHYLIDNTHSNSHTTWVNMAKPTAPTQQQWVQLAAASEVCYYDTAPTVTGNSWTVTFPQKTYSVALIEISH